MSFFYSFFFLTCILSKAGRQSMVVTAVVILVTKFILINNSEMLPPLHTPVVNPYINNSSKNETLDCLMIRAFKETR